ncbi:hypothetical protein [Paeniglutamicibacter psychrophenolicus]|uniref:hypothetical protein n=1 Tax=Paeniglutamicibacter psychrophenolicus TaxID=257454 RepID=UPI00278450F8|nr:hypothetical protein [Paeniglutamicibacter psychrophenolicus]MDQ0094375.1 cell division protein FtsL [Paeniglutamicibacter psychrophenolicus]
MSNRTPHRVRSRVIELPATQGANALSQAPQPIPASRPEESTAKRRTTLSVVPALGAKRRVPFIVSIFVLVIASVVAVLLINVYIANGQYTAVDLRGQERALSQENEALRQEALYLGSPQVVAKKAADLGMVKPGAPAAINLDTGKVAGTATAAEKPSAENRAKSGILKAPAKPGTTTEAKGKTAAKDTETDAPVAAVVPPKSTAARTPVPADGSRPDFSPAQLNGGTIPAPSLKTPGQ